MDNYFKSMRWFKCLVLCLGHILVNLSLAIITVSDEALKEEKDHFFKWFGICIGTFSGSAILASYLIALPIFSCLKKNKVRVHFAILFIAFFYFVNFSVFLWALQHMVIQTTAMQCYAVSGQIGLVFGLLVL